MTEQKDIQTLGQMPKFVSASKVAKVLDISPRSVFRLRSAGKLPAPVKIGGSVRWRLRDIQLFDECNCNMAEFNARKEGKRC
jgi:predicted DNA-binding transcriptional regulator AlpA